MLHLFLLQYLISYSCYSQAFTLRRYSAHLSLTTLICFVGTIQAIAVTLVMEKPSAWSIGFDMNLLAAAYAVRNPKLTLTILCLFLSSLSYVLLKYFRGLSPQASLTTSKGW